MPSSFSLPVIDGWSISSIYARRRRHLDGNLPTTTPVAGQLQKHCKQVRRRQTLFVRAKQIKCTAVLSPERRSSVEIVVRPQKGAHSRHLSGLLTKGHFEPLHIFRVTVSSQGFRRKMFRANVEFLSAPQHVQRYITSTERKKQISTKAHRLPLPSSSRFSRAEVFPIAPRCPSRSGNSGQSPAPPSHLHAREKRQNKAVAKNKASDSSTEVQHNSNILSSTRHCCFDT